LLKKVGLSAAPANAPDYVKNKVHWVMGKNGGEGAFREFVERMLVGHHTIEDLLTAIL